MTRSPSRIRKALPAGVAALSLTGAFVAASATPASATCVSTYKSTDGNTADRTFQIASASTCNDLNIKNATTSQKYRGEFRSGTTWINGSVGWVLRSTTTTPVPVIYNIANGTTVRMTGFSIPAFAWAVH